MNTYNPKVSVLIPCYNGARFIDRCLTSCLNQTYKNLDILVVDDGSVDESLKMLKEWTKKDSRIRIITQSNKGSGEARNTLIKNTDTEYFTFLDVDDTLPSDAISKLVTNSNEGEYDIVVGRTFVINDSRKTKIPFLPAWRYVVNMSNGHYVKSNICTPWCSLIKTSYFKTLDCRFLNGIIFEDLGVMTLVFMNCKKFKYIKDVVYNYHRTKSIQSVNLATQSSFKSMCFKKYNHMLKQMNYLLDNLNRFNLINNKENIRYVNGFLYQAIPVIIFLTKNLTCNKYYRYLLRRNFLNILQKYDITLRFSKTPWKSVAYFYINFHTNKAIRHAKKSIYKERFVEGYIDEKKPSIYKLLRGYNNFEKPDRHEFLYFSLEEFKLNKFIYFKNLNVVIHAKQWNDESVAQINKVVDANNLLPFALISSINSFKKDFFTKHIESFFGYFIDITNESNYDLIVNLFKDIDEIYSSQLKTPLIYLIAKKEQKELVYSLKEYIKGVFYK